VRQDLKKLLLTLPVSFLVFLAVMSEAQQAKKLPRIGVLFPGSREAFSQRTDAFIQGMKDFGYVDGKTISVEWRWAGDTVQWMPMLAGELVKINPDLIVANGTPANQALKAATKTIPILMAVVGDPVGTGLVQSLARPGGNLTGLSIIAPNLSGKRLELLGETAPRGSTIAALVNPNNLVYRGELHETQAAARSSGRRIQALEVTDANTLDEAFVTIKRRQISSLIVMTHPFFFSMRKRILNEAVKLRLAAMYFGSEFTDDGGLMSYGPDMNELFRRAGIYIDKILKGTKPADLPVQQPTKFELVINLKTAKQIGLAIPPNVLARADRVIK
jgi:putative ABC transport system substrate-binding protein